VEGPRVVLDTNILVAALRSRRGASFQAVSEVGRDRFELVVSVPLVVEYEEALTKTRPPRMTEADIARAASKSRNYNNLKQSDSGLAISGRLW